MLPKVGDNFMQSRQFRADTETKAFRVINFFANGRDLSATRKKKNEKNSAWQKQLKCFNKD